MLPRPLDSGAASSAACRQGKKDIGRSRKKKEKKEKKEKKVNSRKSVRWSAVPVAPM